MACAGCAARREWLKKWMKIAYERATTQRSAGSDGGPDRGNDAAGGVKRGPGGDDLPVNGRGD